MEDARETLFALSTHQRPLLTPQCLAGSLLFVPTLLAVSSIPRIPHLLAWKHLSQSNPKQTDSSISLGRGMKSLSSPRAFTSLFPKPTRMAMFPDRPTEHLVLRPPSFLWLIALPLLLSRPHPTLRAMVGLCPSGHGVKPHNGMGRFVWLPHQPFYHLMSLVLGRPRYQQRGDQNTYTIHVKFLISTLGETQKKQPQKTTQSSWEPPPWASFFFFLFCFPLYWFWSFSGVHTAKQQTERGPEGTNSGIIYIINNCMGFQRYIMGCARSHGRYVTCYHSGFASFLLCLQPHKQSACFYFSLVLGIFGVVIYLVY